MAHYPDAARLRAPAASLSSATASMCRSIWKRNRSRPRNAASTPCASTGQTAGHGTSRACTPCAHSAARSLATCACAGPCASATSPKICGGKAASGSSPNAVGWRRGCSAGSAGVHGAIGTVRASIRTRFVAFVPRATNGARSSPTPTAKCRTPAAAHTRPCGTNIGKDACIWQTSIHVARWRFRQRPPRRLHSRSASCRLAQCPLSLRVRASLSSSKRRARKLRSRGTPTWEARRTTGSTAIPASPCSPRSP